MHEVLPFVGTAVESGTPRPRLGTIVLIVFRIECSKERRLCGCTGGWLVVE